MKKILVFTCLVALLFVQGCRGWRSEKPPVHLNPNMDFQPKYKAQSLVLEPPANTVAWGDEAAFTDEMQRKKIVHTRSEQSYFKGLNRDGSFVRRIPDSIDVNHELLSRGRERFNIYCAPCHGQDGSGNGPVTNRGWFKPVSYWTERVVNYRDGKLFDIVSNGYNTMPGYKEQIDESDRWAIVAYIRALQKTQLSTINDVPEEYINQIR